MLARRSPSRTTRFRAAARPRAKAPSSRGPKGGSFEASKGTSMPVTPSSTTSGIPPTAPATTGVPQAMASRLMSPNGS